MQRHVLHELDMLGQYQDDNGMHEQPSPATIQTIYCRTSAGSEARTWLVGLYTNHIGKEAPLNLFPVARDFPQQFLADLVSRTIGEAAAGSSTRKGRDTTKGKAG